MGVETETVRPAAWVGAMHLSDRIVVTGTVLVLRDIRLRRSDLPVRFDEARLLVSPTPESAMEYASALSAAYARQAPYAAPDGVDEHWRIHSMAQHVAARIDANYPGRA
ncbi:hypothetical protein [Herbiconiux sp. A18JL235]|uniref:Uncharacterized protein n=1 Tax=Herbiconiux sp. A18JL235 TaxID=3152363 RepID=A0AB39BEN0_9MICO